MLELFVRFGALVSLLVGAVVAVGIGVYGVNGRRDKESSRIACYLVYAPVAFVVASVIGVMFSSAFLSVLYALLVLVLNKPFGY